jgi:hypothetical protein
VKGGFLSLQFFNQLLEPVDGLRVQDAIGECLEMLDLLVEFDTRVTHHGFRIHAVSLRLTHKPVFCFKRNLFVVRWLSAEHLHLNLVRKGCHVRRQSVEQIALGRIGGEVANQPAFGRIRAELRRT